MNASRLHIGSLVLLSVAVLVLLRWSSLAGYANAAYENLTYVSAPSAERAYTYGARHFDAQRAQDYDIARAEYFFNEVLARDPRYPYVQHQLARIAFLKGDFATALARIDAEIATNPNPSSYYVRGLIKGYMGDYDGAAQDYETYLKRDPNNWAAITDYAWVLLKANRPLDALNATDWGLASWPDNPWLLNGKATAHFELGQLELAYETAQAAQVAVARVTEADWLQAYPGNDPLIAREGIAAFKKAVGDNMHTISLALEKERESVR